MFYEYFAMVQFHEIGSRAKRVLYGIYKLSNITSYDNQLEM